MKPDRIKVGFSDAVRILYPYASNKFSEQLRAVLPLVALMFFFQLVVLQSGINQALGITGGLLGVILGLMFFLEGLRLGLMPLGDTIGSRLPRKASFSIVLLVIFILGIGVTLAEPAIGTLQAVGAAVDPAKAPFLYALLGYHAGALALAIGLGVGIAAILGTLRFVYNFSLKKYLYPSVSLAAVMTIVALFTPGVKEIVGLAWDSGGITTGPVTVPIVLALGIGIARVLSKSHDSGMGGFGIVTLASIFPVITVLILGFVLSATGAIDVASVQRITSEPLTGGAMVASIAMASAQAIIPLVAFMFLVQFVLVRESVHRLDEVLLGIAFCLVGMTVLNFGLNYGLVALGNQVGGLVPGAFSGIQIGAPPVAFGPLYDSGLGIAIAILFGFVIGYGATLAEPALNALGVQVENLTAGAFRKKPLIQTVALGVGTGIAVGVAMMIFHISLAWILLPTYVVVVALTVFSDEKMVNIGWDSAGVTTGPITVPLVIALGLGISGNIPGLIDGFGILALASVFPIMAVLAMGVAVKRKSDLVEEP